MIKFRYIWAAAALGLTFASCSEMDLEPKGILSENTLLKSDEGIKKYLALIYQECPIEDFNYGQNGDLKGYAVSGSNGWHPGNQWQAQKSSPASVTFEAVGRASEYGDGWDYWPYDRIHDINNFLEQLPTYGSNYTEQQMNEYLAEGRFLRAYYYFGMVKRYGGVPIIDRTLDPTAPLDEITFPRDTEYDCWKFIEEDLKFAMEYGTTAKVAGRANRYAAAALMSRAMLYAACNAKYGGYITTTGEATNLGLMGMPSEKAREFFQASYDASKFLRDAGFALHDGADKEKAFVETTTIEVPEEDIFVKQYTDRTDAIWDTSLFHCWDVMTLPTVSGMSSAVGCAIQPTWELASLFEHPAIEDENGLPVRFDRMEDFWDTDKMEPRARATIFFSGMTEPLSGTVIDMQAGVYTSYPGTMADGTEETVRSENEYTNIFRIRAQQPLTSQEVNGVMTKINGNAGQCDGTGDEGYSYTGMLIRKMVSTTDATGRQDLMYCKTPWKVFRYGEILCNWAEAAYELGEITGNAALKQEAIDHVNELRARAGATPYTLNASPEDIGSPLYGFRIDENLQFIRDERVRELCFENQIHFDLRRWRVFDQMFLDGKFKHTLSCYYVIDEGKYIFLPEVDGQGRRTNFYRRWYYAQIPGGAIAKNAKLIRNDGY